MGGVVESRSASREEVIEWVRARIRELEEELRILKGLLALLEGGSGGARPGERIEEVRVGRRRIARLYRGEGYLRLAPEYPMTVTSEARAYLEEVVSEIAERQARDEIPEEEQARLEIRRAPDGAISEIRVEGLHGTLDYLKARAALKYVAEHSYDVYRAQRKAADEI